MAGTCLVLDCRHQTVGYKIGGSARHFVVSLGMFTPSRNFQGECGRVHLHLPVPGRMCAALGLALEQG